MSECARCPHQECEACPDSGHYDPADFDTRFEEAGECDAFGGIGCRHFGCKDWGGDGLCFVQMGG